MGRIPNHSVYLLILCWQAVSFAGATYALFLIELCRQTLYHLIQGELNTSL